MLQAAHTAFCLLSFLRHTTLFSFVFCILKIKYFLNQLLKKMLLSCCGDLEVHTALSVFNLYLSLNYWIRFRCVIWK